MKVLDLRCTHGHVFEGWFGSEDDFLSQLGRGLIECPLCGQTSVERLPSAPRLSLGAAAELSHPSSGERAGQGGNAPSSPQPNASDLQALWMRAARHVLESTDDVGDRFVDEARRIHEGAAPQRGIRGQATAEDAQALREDGIEVFSMPLPDILKGTRH